MSVYYHIATEELPETILMSFPFQDSAPCSGEVAFQRLLAYLVVEIADGGLAIWTGRNARLKAAPSASLFCPLPTGIHLFPPTYGLAWISRLTSSIFSQSPGLNWIFFFFSQWNLKMVPCDFTVQRWGRKENSPIYFGHRWYHDSHVSTCSCFISGTSRRSRSFFWLCT